ARSVSGWRRISARGCPLPPSRRAIACRIILSVMPNFQLNDRVAIVTGASRGLGSAIAEGLVEHGARVVLSSRKQQDLEQEAERINARWGDRAIAISAHAGREPDLERLVNETMARLGRIDILVNNAGTNPYFGGTLDADLAAW